MPKAYSNDLRTRIISYVNEGIIQKKIEEVLKISALCISRIIKRYKETGNISSKIPKVIRPRRVDYEKARKYIEENPDKTLKDMVKFLVLKIWVI